MELKKPRIEQKMGPEDGTYKVQAAPKPVIPEGYVMLKKLRGCNIFQLHYATGEFETIVHSKEFNQKLVKRGIDPEKVEWISDFCYNFGEIIVKLVAPITT